MNQQQGSVLDTLSEFCCEFLREICINFDKVYSIEQDGKILVVRLLIDKKSVKQKQNDLHGL